MKWACLFFCGLFSFVLYGHEYHFRLLPSDYGGDIQQIYLLYQARDGMMWLGTDQGLYSFDGTRYKFFKRKDGIRIRVSTITESLDGEIWAGYEDGQILITTFQGIRGEMMPDSIRGTAISKIVFQSPQDVFITTYGRGVWRWHNQLLRPVREGDLAYVTDIYDALLDEYGKLWLATDEGIKIYIERPGTVVQYLKKQQGLKDDIVTKLAQDWKGNIWIGFYDAGVQRCGTDTYQLSDVLQLGGVAGTLSGMAKGHLSDIWIATDKSVWLYGDAVSGHKIKIPFPLKNRINDICFDQTGNLWLAVGGRLYIANTQIEYVNPGLTGIQAVLPMGNALWYGCASGLYSTDREGGHLQQHLTGEKINVLCLFRDDHDVLWVGTFGQGLYAFDPVTGKVKHLTEKDHLSNTSILNMDGRDQVLWLATLGGVTEVKWNRHPFDGSMSVNDLKNRFQFPPGYVYDVYVSPHGRTWFGTDGKGLYYLEQNEIRSFPVQVPGADSAGMVIKTIYSITEDPDQHLWLSTSKGQVFCVDRSGKILHQYISPQGLLSSLMAAGHGEIVMIREGEIYSVNASAGFFGYDESSGLVSFAPDINATALDKDGSIWIADNDNLVHYFSFAEDLEQKVQLSFESISPGNRIENDLLELKPDSNYLDIAYTGLWYPDPGAIQYRYMLEGHDPDWIYTQEKRAVYSKLSPGKYKFVVQASRNSNFSRANTLEKEILVLPPVYQRWWFVTLAILMVTGAIFWYIRGRIIRIQKLHDLEKEKTMLQLHAIQAQVNPHFLFNSFNTLSSIIEEDQKAAVDYVDQLSAFFRGALMHRQDELIPLAQELDIVRNYAYILKRRYGENIRIDERIESTSGWIAPLSIQLLVENAIKHNIVSADKPLSIEIQILQEWVIVSNPIQPKFQPATESTGFGLSSLLARYAYLTPRKIEILKDERMFTVKIPVIYPEQTS